MSTTIDLLAKALILLGAACMTVAALRRSSASFRALVWTAALGGLLLLPVFSQLTPRWQIAVLPAPPAVDHSPSNPPTGPAVARSSIVQQDPSPVEPIVHHDPAALPPDPVASPSVHRGMSWPLVAGGIWLTGVVLLLVRVLASNIRMRTIATSGSAPTDPRWFLLVRSLRAELGIRRSVAVRMSDEVSIPAVAGVFRPVLLIPAGADDWGADERRNVVLHELAHVARWDALAQLVGQIACAVYWCVPLTWYGARSAAGLRERACDDVVLNAGTRASAYAENLLKLARLCGGAELEPAALAMAGPSRIHERVMGILDPSTRRRPVTGRGTIAVLVLGGGLIGLVSAVEPAARATPVASVSGTMTPGTLAASPTGAMTWVRIPQLAARVTRSAGQSAPRLALPGDTTLFCGHGLSNSSSSIQENDTERTWTVKLTGADCRVDLRAEGKLEFTDDFTDIKSISEGGFFRLDVTDHGVRRQLEVRPRNGGLERSWKVNGIEHPYDPEARAWFAAFLIEMDRRTAIAVDLRLPLLLKQGGVNAVLDETALMSSDYARGQYYSKLLAATHLSGAELTRLLDQAAGLTSSDFYAAELLKSVGTRGMSEPAERAAVVALIRKMTSDFYRAEGMKTLIAAGHPTSAEMDVLLQVVAMMESDFYMSESLKALLGNGSLTPEQRASAARMVRGIKSGFYAAEVLKTLSASGALSPAERAAFLEVVTKVDGDNNIAEILQTLIDNRSPAADEVGTVLQGSAAIQSDFYRSEVLGRLLGSATLSEKDLLSVVDLTRAMQDFAKGETLRKVLHNRGSDNLVRDAVLQAADSMSGYYKNEVRRAAGVSGEM